MTGCFFFPKTVVYGNYRNQLSAIIACTVISFNRQYIKKKTLGHTTERLFLSTIFQQFILR